MFSIADLNEQHVILNKISNLIEQGDIRTTVDKHLGSINAKNLRISHHEIKSKKTIGKIVLDDF